MSDLDIWFARWGDIASVVGVVLSLGGFWYTILGVSRARTAAEQARSASIATGESIGKLNAISTLSTAMAIMEEIKRHQRSRTWVVLPDRYAELRRHLGAIVASNLLLTEEQREPLRRAIRTFAKLEQTVERAIATQGVPPNPPKLNEIVASQIDEVHVVLLFLQKPPLI